MHLFNSLIMIIYYSVYLSFPLPCFCFATTLVLCTIMLFITWFGRLEFSLHLEGILYFLCGILQYFITRFGLAVHNEVSY